MASTYKFISVLVALFLAALVNAKDLTIGIGKTIHSDDGGSETEFNGPSICTRNPLTELIIGGCPNECLPLSSELFLDCSRLSSTGCGVRNCVATGESAKPVKCAVDPESYRDVTLCAGNTLVLDGVDFGPVSYNVGIRVPPVEKQYKKTDIFIIADANNGDATADRARVIAHKVVDTFESYKGVNFGFGVLRHKKGDYDDFLVRAKITSNVHLVKEEVDWFRAQVTGEPNLFALETASSARATGWRKDANRILMYVSERPFQEPTSYLHGDVRKCLTRDDVISSLKSAQVTVIPVNLGDIDGFPSRNTVHQKCGYADEGQATAFAKATGGEVVMGRDPENVVAAVNSRVEEVPVFKYLDLDVSDCHGLVKAVRSTPSFPQPVKAGGALDSLTEISLKNSVCHKPHLHCTFKYSLDGEHYTSVGLKLKNIKC